MIDISNSLNLIEFMKFILNVNKLKYNNNLLLQKLLLDNLPFNYILTKDNIDIENNIYNLFLKYFPNRDISIYNNLIKYFKINEFNFKIFYTNLEKNLVLFGLSNKIYETLINNKNNLHKILYYFQQLLEYYLIYNLNIIITYIENIDIIYVIPFDTLFNEFKFNHIFNISSIVLGDIIKTKMNLLQEINKVDKRKNKEIEIYYKKKMKK